METRTRSKRAQPSTAEDDVAAPRPSKRGRRQDAAAEEEQLDQASDEGAGRQESQRSSGRQTAEPQPQSQSQSQDSESDTEGRRQMIELSLPDLTDQAHRLIAFMSGPEEDRRNSAKRRFHATKRSYFENDRRVFEGPHGFPFIDAEKLDFIAFSADDLVSIRNANFATALGIIEDISIEDGDGVSTLEHLRELDQFLHKLFDPFQTDVKPDMALEIRTLRFIKEYEEEQDTSKTSLKMAKVQELLASTFCDPSALDDEVEYHKLFVNGPFRPITSVQNGKQDDLCSTRITKILSRWKKSAKATFLSKLKETFPEKEALEALRKNILDVYEYSKAEKIAVDQGAAAQSQERFHDAREAIDIDDLESVADSQPIVRATGPEQSLFTKENYRILVDDSGPSDTQQAVVDDSNSAILGPRPASVAPSTASGMPHRQRTAPASTSSPRENEDDDDEDGSFQEDTRAINSGRVAERREQLNTPPLLPPAATPNPMAPPPRPTSRPPSSSARQPSSSAPQSSSPEQPSSSAFDLIKAEKKRITGQSTGQQKQRHPWSEKDQFTLIELIAKCQASWSRIQDYNKCFEHPREQQAYRDKARNMKVDFLWTDRVLPPCFDMVRLGPKEVAKLRAVGKNPDRRENDLDDEGTPINTEIRREE